jgi:hypothetical protein
VDKFRDALAKQIGAVKMPSIAELKARPDRRTGVGVCTCAAPARHGGRARQRRDGRFVAGPAHGGFVHVRGADRTPMERSCVPAEHDSARTPRRSGDQADNGTCAGDRRRRKGGRICVRARTLSRCKSSTANMFTTQCLIGWGNLFGFLHE